MKKIKKFWNENKTVICIIGGVVVSITTAILLCKKSNIIVESGRKIVSLNDDPSIVKMDLERVKSMLEESKDNDDMYIIFREGANLKDNNYTVMSLTDVKTSIF